ncbi:hypothetical protein RhiirA1_458806 [Rhizophagus irregularis]|uniref:Uncharacterized protein n=2 Tax=Rhizophagus irregularis TaxID=588596 RepID=A0A2N0RUZ0_9GLOM|nr:hypothetical protein RhiirA1_458806 [Rhizophagus irregularis]
MASKLPLTFFKGPLGLQNISTNERASFLELVQAVLDKYDNISSENKVIQTIEKQSGSNSQPSFHFIQQAVVKEFNDMKDNVSRLSSPSSFTKKKRKIASVSKANNSQSSSKTTKKQSAATLPKTISTIMTEYMPMNKDFIQKIMVYDILSTWSQLDMFNHFKT